jgi:hypothetical protein
VLKLILGLGSNARLLWRLAYLIILVLHWNFCVYVRSGWDNLSLRPILDEQLIFDKLRALPPERVAEVVDFIDFLAHRSQSDRQLSRAATKLSEDAFARVWDNLEDSAYDNL